MSLRTEENQRILEIIKFHHNIDWSMNSSLSTELVTRVLMMAMLHRNPERGIIFHSERGTQYTSSSFRKILKNRGIIQSNGQQEIVMIMR